MTRQNRTVLVQQQLVLTHSKRFGALWSPLFVASHVSIVFGCCGSVCSLKFPKPLLQLLFDHPLARLLKYGCQLVMTPPRGVVSIYCPLWKLHKCYYACMRDSSDMSICSRPDARAQAQCSYGRVRRSQQNGPYEAAVERISAGMRRFAQLAAGL